MQSTLKRTNWVWTKAICNYSSSNPTLRFLLFEIDTKDINILNEVLAVYRKYNLSVYYHETGNGYHFISISPMSKVEHAKAVREIKHLNPLCPLIALRIKTNKWENEKQIWKNGTVEDNECHELYLQLTRLREWIEQQRLGLIMKHYKVVTYPLEECPKCKKSDKIRYQYDIKKFKCMRCNIYSIARGNGNRRLAK